MRNAYLDSENLELPNSYNEHAYIVKELRHAEEAPMSDDYTKTKRLYLRCIVITKNLTIALS